DERGGREPEVCRIGLVDSQRGAWRVGRCRQKVVDQAIGKAASPDREGRGWLAPANGVPGISGSTVEPGRVDPRPLTWRSMSEDRIVRHRQSNPPADLDDVWVTFGEWNRLCAVPWQEPKQGDSTVSSVVEQRVRVGSCRQKYLQVTAKAIVGMKARCKA